jgi:hypothetical protein
MNNCSALDRLNVRSDHLRGHRPHGTKISLATETESPGVGPPEMT